MRHSCLAICLLAMCATARAQENCPWLTQGTASALMGGPVTATVHASAGEGSCEFLFPPGDDHAKAARNNSLQLKIVVGHTPSKECAAGEPITGVGEDSVFCAADIKNEHREVIRGRVRSTDFLLTLTARGSSASDKASLKSSLQQAAEEVAGNLF
jgi:hypothetical protein